jgi:hypothetical protein
MSGSIWKWIYLGVGLGEVVDEDEMVCWGVVEMVNSERTNYILVL